MKGKFLFQLITELIIKCTYTITRRFIYNTVVGILFKRERGGTNFLGHTNFSGTTLLRTIRLF